MGAEFDAAREVREAMDAVFRMMGEDPSMGPKLRDAKCPQRFDFDDVDMVVNVRAGARARTRTSTGSGPTTSPGSPRCR